MIIRSPKASAEPTPFVPVSEPVAVKQIVLRDVELNFGPADSVSFTLVPNDIFEMREDTYYVFLTNANEEIHIDKRLVRWRSIRSRTETIPVSFDPAILDPANS